jgi:bifunctional DNA-binding transcriptional regulator/antitoxin component of YhaV-PrlF toxin-antitoxin module
METTKLSSDGQVTIPQVLREIHQWQAGQEFVAIDTGDGILLKPKTPFVETTLEAVAGYLKYDGTPISLEEMEDAIRRGVEETWDDRR